MLWYIVIVLLLLGLVITILKLFYDVFVICYDQAVMTWRRYQPLQDHHRAILKRFSAYYNLLSDANKKQFEKRVQRFMNSKKFIPRVFETVTDEMKVLISASAIQLVFGLPGIYLANFDKILVYPDSYYSRIGKKYHLGEVNPRAGIIILSWKSFIKGYADLKDALNLGIHEMAHAIHFENRIKNEEYDFLDYEALQTLAAITKREMPKIREGNGHFLRGYAGTNEYEFFAVSLEHFFEDPVGFQAALPDLYVTLKALLNQDPIKLYKLAS